MELTTLVVDILKLGLIGLVFLLMLLGFRILHSEQIKESPNAQVLKRATVFVWQSIIVAALLGAVEITHRVIDRPVTDDQRAEACFNEIDALRLVAQHPDQTVGSLRSAIRNTWTACGLPGQGEDDG